MEITVLGTGTSSGVPVPGCTCAVCTSKDSRDSRTRTSALFVKDGFHLIIDTSPDFYTQCIREGIRRVDAVLYTHDHADHLHGIDDIRPFTWQSIVPIYADRFTAHSIRQRFPYLFKPRNIGGGKPNVELNILSDQSMKIGPFQVQRIPVLHGEEEISGFRIDDCAWISDCKIIPEAAFGLLQGLEVLFLNALKREPHETHLSLSEAATLVSRIDPRRAFFMHFSHDQSHADLSRQLRAMDKKIEPAFDGLSFSI